MLTNLIQAMSLVAWVHFMLSMVRYMGDAKDLHLAAYFAIFALYAIVPVIASFLGD